MVISVKKYTVGINDTVVKCCRNIGFICRKLYGYLPGGAAGADYSCYTNNAGSYSHVFISKITRITHCMRKMYEWFPLVKDVLFLKYVLQDRFKLQL